MRRKDLISIIIIVAALVGAAIFGYMAFTRSSVNTSSTEPITSSRSSILPEGTELDFTDLETYNQAKRVFPYPEVNSQEVGLPVNQILR